jgi:nicotinamide mononucleotide (NMN) deamidase PncC
MNAPAFEELTAPSSAALDQLKTMAHKAAYDVLVELNTRATRDLWLQIATTESLTAGLIMSTLVDIPWGGYLKYGCFGVYDTDAKRVFNGVRVDDVYTHLCAKEMAVGVLKNSNASIAVAVTGNAMPLNDHAKMLGEVFIGVAGYNDKGEIIYLTKSINACIESDIDEFKSTCKTWYSTIVTDKKYNSRTATALVSQEIRNYTTYKALTTCLEFIQKHDPKPQGFVFDRKKKNEIMGADSMHTDIPPNKYEMRIGEVCVEDSCDALTPQRRDVKEYTGARRTRRNRRRAQLRHA